MPSWVHSLQFRLVVGFASVMALALAGVSAYSSLATRQAIDQFEREVAAARVARLQSMVSRAYEPRADMAALQATLEQAGELFGWRIAIEDPDGALIADSRRGRGFNIARAHRKMRRRPIVIGGRVVAELLVQSETFPDADAVPLDFAAPSGPRRSLAPPSVEPQMSRLASSFNRSLVWAGLAAGGLGIALIGFSTRRALAPVRVLTDASRALGRGDLSQRVPASTRDEVGELARTFNGMASQLEHSEKLRQTLTADVAHELRTPLSNLQGYLEAINDRLLEPDAETIRSLHAQVLHLTRLVEDLRVLALMEAGDLPLRLAPDRVDQIVALTVDSFRPRADEKSISLTLDADPDIPPARVDRTRLRQVIGNLVDNALTHTPDGGEISVAVGRAAGGRQIRVTVSDTGAGIRAEHLPHIFDRLYRTDRSRARATGGAGLGLTIVKQIVEAHEGRVWAESEPGKGSRFVVELPSILA